MNDERLAALETEIQEIRSRNLRVEADKAWETSKCRLLSISLLTYLVAAASLYLLGNEKFYLNALVPVLGFILSAQSLPALKTAWIERFYQKP